MPEVFDRNPNAPWNNEEEPRECRFCRNGTGDEYCSSECERFDILGL